MDVASKHRGNIKENGNEKKTCTQNQKPTVEIWTHDGEGELGKLNIFGV